MTKQSGGFQWIANDDDSPYGVRRASDGAVYQLPRINSSGSLVDGAGNSYALGIFNIAASSYYGFALRASQGGFGSPLDQSGKLNDPAINTALFPAVRQNSTAYSLGAYRSPAVSTGKLYKCTTAGTSTTSEPAGFASAAIGATITDGSAVWTVERGPWHTAASGFRHVSTIASGLIGSALGSFTFPAINWDMANGDSLIIRIRQAWDANTTDSRSPPSEAPFLGNRHVSTDRKGIQIIATGPTYKDLKLNMSDGVTSISSGHVSASFNRPPLDGNVRDTVFMVDGLLKRVYAWTDGVSYAQSEMYSGGEKTPHQMDVSTITGSTLSPYDFMFGATPGSATSYDMGAMALDVLVLPGRSLPTNTQAIADFYYSRGTDALLPASLMLA